MKKCIKECPLYMFIKIYRSLMLLGGGSQMWFPMDSVEHLGLLPKIKKLLICVILGSRKRKSATKQMLIVNMNMNHFLASFDMENAVCATLLDTYSL